MDKPPSRRKLVTVATVASSLLLAAVVVAPTLAGASTRRDRAAAGAMVKVETSKEYGKILVSASGRTLYLLTDESTKALKCTGGCLGLWSALLTKGKPLAGAGIVAKELGTVKRGSSLQVTYYGHPLYTYAGDKAAGQTNGEGIESFGGWWYVLDSAGSPVKAALTSSSGGSSGGW